MSGSNNYKYVHKAVRSRVVSSTMLPASKRNPFGRAFLHQLECGHDVRRRASQPASPTGLMLCRACTVQHKAGLREALQQEQRRLARQLNIIDRRLQSL
jgi:hypothetical protein